MLDLDIALALDPSLLHQGLCSAIADIPLSRCQGKKVAAIFAVETNMRMFPIAGDISTSCNEWPRRLRTARIQSAKRYKNFELGVARNFTTTLLRPARSQARAWPMATLRDMMPGAR
jgi:hypothetical protein